MVGFIRGPFDIHSGSIRGRRGGRLECDLGSIQSIRGRSWSGVNLGSISGRSWLDSGSCRSQVGSGWILGRPGVDLGSILSRSEIDSGRLWADIGPIRSGAGAGSEADPAAPPPSSSPRPWPHGRKRSRWRRGPWAARVRGPRGCRRRPRPSPWARAGAAASRRPASWRRPRLHVTLDDRSAMLKSGQLPHLTIVTRLGASGLSLGEEADVGGGSQSGLAGLDQNNSGPHQAGLLANLRAERTTSRATNMSREGPLWRDS